MPTPQTTSASLLLKSATKIDALTLDVAISENHVGEVEVTENPVEQGFAVADHARPKPAKLTLQGIVSNTPLSHAQRLRAINVMGREFQSASDEDSIVGEPGPAQRAFSILNDLRENARLITVSTSLRVYPNMIMTSLVIPKSKDTGDSFQFTAQFTTVRIVDNKLTAAKSNTGAYGPKKVSTGKKVTKKTDDPTKEKSIAYQLAEKLGLLEKLGIKVPK